MLFFTERAFDIFKKLFFQVLPFYFFFEITVGAQTGTQKA